MKDRKNLGMPLNKGGSGGILYLERKNNSTMAWQGHRKPQFKMCKGFGRRPHSMLYDFDFPTIRRTLKNGTVAEYAGTLCTNCKNRYDRDRRRRLNRADGRANRPQDIPWKRYQDGSELVPERRGLKLVMVELREAA